MKKSTKISLGIGTTLILLLAAAFIFIWLLIQNSLPQQEGNAQFAEIRKPVEITYDKMGIPQIWADNEHDAFFAFGYLHASDRMFQMDMTRRVAEGRLAELLGPTVLNIDIHQRTVGHYRIAEKFLPKLSAENRAKLQAYVDGINAYKHSCGALPFEYQLLRTDFEDWTIKDCLAEMSFQTWFSDFLMSPDAFLAEMADTLGAGKIRSLNVPYPQWAPFCTPQNASGLSGNSGKTTPIQNALAAQLFKNSDLPFRMSNSSNTWVIAPHKSKSGHAMLASDPHLETTRLPQFWYQIGLHIKETGVDVLGISTPGLPFITMGHNKEAAWAFTVSGVDVNEYFIEKLRETDSTQYLSNEGWKPLRIFPQKINVSGYEKPYTFNVRLTGHGPLVFENDSLRQHYALHWAGFDIDLNDCFSAGFHLIKVDNYADFQKDVTRFGALDANWTYADAKGNIGYQLGTPVAIRPAKQDNLPVPGWSGAYDWRGFYPLEKTPHSYNPPRGWLASCNNKQDSDTPGINIYGNYASDRILRITELLNSKEKFSVQDMYDFQMDTTDAFLTRWNKTIGDLLLKAGNKTEAEKIYQWDGSCGIHSREAALVNLFLNRLRHLTFDDELGERSAKVLFSDLDQIYHNGPYEWFDNSATKNAIETKDQITARALQEALAIRGQKSWGDFQTLTMRHPLSVVPVVSDLLKLKYGPMPWAGTAGTLNASFYFEDKNKPNHFESTVGPSWRFVIDFADKDAATFVLPAGNSGNPASPHFMDFFAFWKSGKRWTVPVSRKPVYERAEKILILEGNND